MALAPAASVVYTTIEGDRWDNLAYRAYGDPTLYDVIMQANPLVPIQGLIAGGTQLVIPIVDTAVTSLDKSLLPPWKQ